MPARAVGAQRLEPAAILLGLGCLALWTTSCIGTGGTARTVEGPSAAPIAGQVVQVARSLIGASYRYAGNGPRSFDCSGLVAYAFGRVGVPLPRAAREQAKAGRWVALDELRPGDLLFFGDRRDAPSHVGLVVSAPGQTLTIVHASESRGVVETEVLENSYWLGRLLMGRRVLEEPLGGREAYATSPRPGE